TATLTMSKENRRCTEPVRPRTHSSRRRRLRLSASTPSWTARRCRSIDPAQRKGVAEVWEVAEVAEAEDAAREVFADIQGHPQMDMPCTGPYLPVDPTLWRG